MALMLNVASTQRVLCPLQGGETRALRECLLHSTQSECH